MSCRLGAVAVGKTRATCQTWMPGGTARPFASVPDVARDTSTPRPPPSVYSPSIEVGNCEGAGSSRFARACHAAPVGDHHRVGPLVSSTKPFGDPRKPPSSTETAGTVLAGTALGVADHVPPPSPDHHSHCSPLTIPRATTEVPSAASALTEPGEPPRKTVCHRTPSADTHAAGCSAATDGPLWPATTKPLDVAAAALTKAGGPSETCCQCTSSRVMYTRSGFDVCSAPSDGALNDASRVPLLHVKVRR